MWTSQTEAVDEGMRRVTVQRDRCPSSRADVLAGWQNDEDFRAFFIRLLAEAPYDAYLWETPPVARATAERGFECMLMDNPALARLKPDASAFAPHFEAARPGADVVTFPNLGGDAFLVAPLPRGGAYPHLAAFARGAPAAQQHALWRAVGAQVTARLSGSPLWLSTCGLGVAWLHVRLDSRPKYYAYRPYREAPHGRLD